MPDDGEGAGDVQAIGVPSGSVVTSVSVGNREHRAISVGVYDESGTLLGRVDGSQAFHVGNVVFDQPVAGPATLRVAMLLGEQAKDAIDRMEVDPQR